MLTSSLTLIIKFTIIGAFALIAFILLAVAAASLIGNLAGSDTLGYVYTAGIFLILAFIIYGLRKKIENSIIKNLSTRIYKDL